jgi:hypothetical protein
MLQQGSKDNRRPGVPSEFITLQTPLLTHRASTNRKLLEPTTSTTASQQEHFSPSLSTSAFRSLISFAGMQMTNHSTLPFLELRRIGDVKEAA